jgi:CRP-like cAMP-binding protein
VAGGGDPRRRPRYTLVVRRLVGERSAAQSSGIEIVPFVRGRRPTDEARHPGLGSSDHAALVLGDESRRNRAYVLFTAEGADVEATLALTGHDGAARPALLPGWARRSVELRCFSGEGDGSLLPAAPGAGRFVLTLDPERDLQDADDAYGFAHLFLQRVRVELRLGDGAAAEAHLDVADVRRLGSLYARILERAVVPDTERQAAAAGVVSPGHAYHPWYPVLLIGTDKAALYTRALVGDVVDKQRHLAEPAWLLRVGIYLELLTCLGIVEAVRDELGDLLDPEEREAFEGERFAPIRARIDPDAWRGVWSLREIAFPRRGMPSAGPVSYLNLLHKRKATLTFLHAHHEDLKGAIALAGPNPYSAQETWQRVFRDAERAVLRQTAHAFPELGYLPAAARHFVLWHRRGRLAPAVRLPSALTALFADQDGLYASACNQYRASMNHVAAWARQEGLMDASGRECISRRVSLLEAHMNDPDRVAVLQRRDGYAESLDATAPLEATEPVLDDAAELLGAVSIFAMLAPDELRDLARSARPLPLGPTERFVIQGTEGSSLFVVADGEVEVVLRRDGEPDLRTALMRRGAVVGEMSLLTGEPRRATVRAVDGALVYEIGREQYAPLLLAHREWVDELATVMETRLREREAVLASHDAHPHRHELAARIRRHFFGADGTGTTAD